MRCSWRYTLMALPFNTTPVLAYIAAELCRWAANTNDSLRGVARWLFCKYSLRRNNKDSEYNKNTIHLGLLLREYPFVLLPHLYSTRKKKGICKERDFKSRSHMIFQYFTEDSEEEVPTGCEWIFCPTMRCSWQYTLMTFTLNTTPALAYTAAELGRWGILHTMHKVFILR